MHIKRFKWSKTFDFEKKRRKNVQQNLNLSAYFNVIVSLNCKRGKTSYITRQRKLVVR